MAASDAKPVPVKAVAFRVTFPILDADGDLVAGATGLDSEFSEDAVGFADCASEATQIATSSGMYYLDIAATEIDGDTCAYIIKSTEGKTTPIVLYPQSAANPIHVDIEAISGDATAANNAEAFFDGTGYAGTNNVIPTVTTVNGLGADAITAAATAADFGAEVAAAVWDLDATAHQTGGTFGQAIGDPGASTETLFKAIVTDPAGTNIAADVIAVKADTAAILADTGTDGVVVASLAANSITASALAADAVDEIWDEAMTETGGTPAVTASFRDALRWMFALSRNKITQTATTQTLRNDADAGNLATAAVSDDGTTATRAEWV